MLLHIRQIPTTQSLFLTAHFMSRNTISGSGRHNDVGVLTDGVEPGARPLPHGTKALVLGLAAAHRHVHGRRSEGSVGKSSQWRRHPTTNRHLPTRRPPTDTCRHNRHLPTRRHRPPDRKSVDVEMVLVSAVNDLAYVRHANESYSLGGAAWYYVRTSMHQLCTTIRD